ncbi:MFS transporter [Micromonospora sp. DR5-3]|uniref:MFS transporter n=1 Tax=unclassified Micromonospora TaxID=2617518 RepID=UPI0011D9E718|nr:MULTISPECIES: MFS transporter [unclassified Micromonospora]MCW3817968.1 MFS transporter [Micromonospora sp. DR5-3]TYC21423.1 MFS transporter [Micromonospora sp. MP36]
MYISVRNPQGTPVTSRAVRRGIPQTVLVLGAVSLLTDISTEMVTAALPLFVTVGLGLSPLAFGVLDSVYQAGTAAARIAGGFTADRLRRPKAVATVGYALGVLAKLVLLPAASLGALSAAVGVDRIGKGLRTGPRDALIAGCSAPEALGRSFGMHRALDTAGALLGPVFAFYLLTAAPRDFDTLFVVSACIAGLGVLLLVSKVREERSAAEGAPRISLAGAARLVAQGRKLRRMLLAAGLLSAMTISDAFLYLTLLERGAVSSRLFPLLFLATSLVYLIGAIPLGRLADRFGRIQMFLTGHLLIVGAYLVAAGSDGLPSVGLALALLGLYYAATDGVLPAAAATIVPPQWMSTAISTLQTCVALGRSLAAIIFGALWAAIGPGTALWLFTAGMAVVLALTTPALLRRPSEV